MSFTFAEITIEYTPSTMERYYFLIRNAFYKKFSKFCMHAMKGYGNYVCDFSIKTKNQPIRFGVIVNITAIISILIDNHCGLSLSSIQFVFPFTAEICQTFSGAVKIFENSVSYTMLLLTSY